MTIDSGWRQFTLCILKALFTIMTDANAMWLWCDCDKTCQSPSDVIIVAYFYLLTSISYVISFHNVWSRRDEIKNDSKQYLQDTCRMAAPEFRYGLEVQQTSVQNRPIFFARSRSSLVLKPLTVFAITEALSSIFHLDTTRWEKKYFVISLLHRHLTSFNECPRPCCINLKHIC